MLLADLWGPGVEIIDPFFIIGENILDNFENLL